MTIVLVILGVLLVSGVLGICIGKLVLKSKNMTAEKQAREDAEQAEYLAQWAERHK